MQDMKITYIGHSGFAVRWDGHAAVFDYFQGEVPEFEKDTKIYVFASHAHYDHFQPCIFEWASKYPDITYILSSDIKYRMPEEISAEQVYYETGPASGVGRGLSGGSAYSEIDR